MNKEKSINKAFSVLICVISTGLFLYIITSLAYQVYANVKDNTTASLVSVEGKYFDSYVEQLEYCVQMVLAVDDKASDTVSEITISCPDIEDEETVCDALEAAGIDISRITRDEDGVCIYIIERGDTLTKISAAFGYSVDAIADYNSIRNVNLIYAESALRIPQ